MALRIEIERKWFEANKDSLTQTYLDKYTAETELAKTHYIIEFPNEKFHFDDYDGKGIISINNYIEDFKGAFYISIELEPTAKEWGIFAEKLVKMFNKLKNIIESI